MARSLSEITTSMVGTISANIPDISTKDGTVVKDVVIDAPAQEFANVYVENDAVRLLLSLQNYDSFTIEELDNVASDYGLTRLAGMISTGTLVFRYKTLADINIAYNTPVATSSSSTTPNVSFIVSQTVVVPQANLSALYNYITSFYEVPVNIESVNTGIANNVASGSIVSLPTNTSNADSIYNYLATSGGTDKETNQALAARILLKVLGNNIGTQTGYESTIAADNRVIDSIIAGPNDVEMVRNEYGGSIDAYILGTDLAEVTEIYDYNLGMTQITFLHKPVHLVTLVTSASIGTGTPLVEGTDYTVTPDVGLYKKSSASTDTITLTPVGIGKLSNPDQLTITYSYNKLIEDLQTVVDGDTEHIITADVLIREAIEILVNVTVKISKFSGYNTATVKGDVETAISNLLNTYTLNKDLNPSDLVGVTEGVAGVDKVDLSSLIPSSSVIANKTQYLRPGTLTISII